nr:nuclear shuttle protein [Ramie yellow mosaic virus]
MKSNYVTPYYKNYRFRRFASTAKRYTPNKIGYSPRPYAAWKSRVPNRSISAVVDLFGDPSSRQYKRKELSETQHGSDYVVQNNRYVSTYVTLPSKSRTQINNRLRSYIKLNKLYINGTCYVHTNGMETDTSNVQMLFGLLSIVVVRDKLPKLYSSAEPFMPFPSLFGSIESCRGVLKVAEQYKDRFVLLKHTSVMVNSPDGVVMRQFKTGNCIPNSYTTWSSFKDDDEDNLSGQYSNTSRNALLVYYVWLSDVPSQVDLYSHINLKYIG